VKPRRVLLLSGSLRRGSTNTALVRTAATLSVPGVVAQAYEGLASLPAFNPDDDVDPLPVEAESLRAQIRSSDALLFSTPEYAGALPGSFKNLLDWTVGDAEPRSISEKPVGMVNVSSLPAGAANAERELRTVLGYVNARIVEPAWVRLPVPRPAVGEDGQLGDEALRTALAGVLQALVGVLGPTGSEG
jgi:chromate reductase, NAD(P)H dehydrogenase (quinone)